jgi:ribosomal protein S6--L-glutamate ligase
MADLSRAIALGARLQGCTNVRTLGVRANFFDYSPGERDLIQKAAKIYYPSSLYAELFDAMGKGIFPSIHTYRYAQDKIKQTALFQLLNIDHPRTRVFYGRRQKQTINDYFNFPCIGKQARGSAMGRGVYLIRNPDELRAYLNRCDSAYIQEYLPVDRDIRVVIIGGQIVHAYWRIAPCNDFRANLAAGGHVCLDPVPHQAMGLALNTAESCGWNDVGIDIIAYQDRFYVIEGNMKYGKEGFRKAGIDYVRLMESLIDNGVI